MMMKTDLIFTTHRMNSRTMLYYDAWNYIVKLFITAVDAILITDWFLMVIVITECADMLPFPLICVLANFWCDSLTKVKSTHAGSVTVWVILLTIAQTLFVLTVRSLG